MYGPRTEVIYQSRKNNICVVLFDKLSFLANKDKKINFVRRDI